MIDINDEHVITLTVAARLIPPRRAGRRCNLATVYRWTMSGCRGVVLESIQVGGTRCTSQEALQRFIERLTALALGHRVTAGDRSLAQRQRASELAAERLDALGI